MGVGRLGKRPRGTTGIGDAHAPLGHRRKRGRRNIPKEPVGKWLIADIHQAVFEFAREDKGNRIVDIP